MLNELIKSSDLFAGLGGASKSFTPAIKTEVTSNFSWSELDDRRLLEQVSRLGENRWNLIGKKLGRSSIQCRDRYVRFLRPRMLGSWTGNDVFGIKPNHSSGSLLPTRPWFEEEDATVAELYQRHGPVWERIANDLASVSNSTGAMCYRTPDEVQQRCEQLFRHRLPERSLEEQENYPPSCVNLRNSLISWSSSIRRTSPALHEVESDREPVGCASITLGPSNLDLIDDGAAVKSRLSGCKPEPSATDVPSGAPYVSMPLLNQLSLKQQSNLDRLTISLPCVPESQSSMLTSRPLMRQSRFLSSATKKPRPTYKLKFTTPWSQRLIPRSPHSPLAKDFTSDPSKESAFLRTKTSSYFTTANSTAGGTTGLVVDDSFLVQTPTKALSEADQLSFHLSSPPAVLRNLVTGNGTARYVGRALKPESDQTTARSRDAYLSSKPTERNSVCTRLFDGPTSCSRVWDQPASLIRPSSVPTLPTSRPLIPTGCSASFGTASNDAKCLAVLTAKATVWSKAFSPVLNAVPSFSVPKINHSVAMDHHPVYSTEPAVPFGGSDGSRIFGASYFALREPLLPALRLRIPPRKQPELATRRVVQVGFEHKWRRFALGLSKAHRLNTRMARQFLNDCAAFERFTDSTMEATTSSPSSSPRSHLDSLLAVKVEPTDPDPIPTRSPVRLNH